ncbi:hypothetical protein U6G28_05715 [Actinomycetaceae bacterium MB13-C1-2]|nr:hypothetical protein U6G28_05715 [Actinomycetaceae bacterium MB13-C1-2]
MEQDLRREVLAGVCRLFPEDRNYEDQQPAIRAAVAASTFDVVDYDVYSWRLPKGPRNRSQSKQTIQDLADRERVIIALLELAKRMPPTAQDHLRKIILGRDLCMYLKQVLYTTDEYWNVLHALTKELYDTADRAVFRDIPFSERLLCYLGANGTRDDVETLIAASVEYGQTPQ